jgi:hypothetical protein
LRQLDFEESDGDMNALPDFPEGSEAEANARYNLRLIRKALAFRTFAPP